MKFSLPGQLRGPECNRVMQQAVVLRRKLEPWFASIASNEISELGIALRVDGSLGSFGPEGTKNISIRTGKVECDVVISDKGWAELGDEEVASILHERVFEAISICFERFGISFDVESTAACLR